jgi:hypothetical protein
MKKVEVFSMRYDTRVDPYHPSFVKDTIRTWLDTSEEGVFIVQHSKKPVDIMHFDNPCTLESLVVLHAFLDEEIETFWRLKFK